MGSKAINGYQSILTENGKVIFDLPQKGHRCTFFKDGKSVKIEIIKEGYKTVKTKPFSTDDEMEFANLIKVTLEKE
jgi:flagellar hook assembly protein FlgD